VDLAAIMGFGPYLDHQSWPYAHGQRGTMITVSTTECSAAGHPPAPAHGDLAAQPSTVDL